jgi:hypothetical protein
MGIATARRSSFKALKRHSSVIVSHPLLTYSCERINNKLQSKIKVRLSFQRTGWKSSGLDHSSIAGTATEISIVLGEGNYKNGRMVAVKLRDEDG